MSYLALSWLQRTVDNKAVLVHGWDGGPDKHWFPWLGKKLSELGYGVFNVPMPNPSKPSRKTWVKHLQDHITVDDNTVFVAHSIGCIAVLRYLEKISDTPRALIFVAPFTENEKKYKTVKSFFHGKLNWKQIKKCSKIYTLHSDDDPFVSPWQRFVFKEEANAINVVQKDKGHFTGKTLPKVLEIIKNL